MGSSRNPAQGRGLPSTWRLGLILGSAALLLALATAAIGVDWRSRTAEGEQRAADVKVARRLASRVAPLLASGAADEVEPLAQAVVDLGVARVEILDGQGRVVVDTSFDRALEPAGLEAPPEGAQEVDEEGATRTLFPIRFGTELVGEVRLSRPSTTHATSVWFWRDFSFVFLVSLSLAGLALWLQHGRAQEIQAVAGALGRLRDGQRSELDPEGSGGELASLRYAVLDLDQTLSCGADRVAHTLITMSVQMVDALERRGQATPGHGERTGRYAEILAERLGLPPEDRRDLDLAARLHELGKMWVRPSILFKDGELTSVERESFRQYPVRGADALEGPPSLRQVARVVRHHKERYDGGGFPEGLRGDRIPMGSRILSIAAAYDELTSCNFKGEAVPWDAALESMREDRGVHFDPVLLDVFEDEIRKAPTPELPDTPVLLTTGRPAPYRAGDEKNARAAAEAESEQDLLSIDDLQIMFDESPDEE